MKAPDLLPLFAGLRQHQTGGQRAPHKPLLLLWSLARVARGELRLAPWSVLHDPVERILAEFGRPGARANAHYPLWRLRSDGLWAVEHEDELASFQTASGDVRIGELNRLDPGAGFTSEVWEALRADPGLARRAAQVLLDDNFPATLHEDILLAVGMPPSGRVEEGVGSTAAANDPGRRRDPAFRETILRIYEHRCAVCGYQGRLGNRDLGLEAAHVRWHTHDGPDREDNGLALCSFHHRILDSGAISLDEDRRLLVSQEVHGGGEVDRLILDHHGHPLRGPLSGAPPVATEHAAWHRQEVFRRPARPRAAEA